MVLADRASPTWRPMSFDATKVSGVSVRSRGGKIAEVSGSSWMRMGVSLSITSVARVLLVIIKTRADALNTRMMRILLNIPLIDKYSRVERLLAR